MPPAGAIVTLRGLQSKPELNGRKGTVLAPTHNDEAAAGYAKGRVPVQLIGNGGTLLLKPESLEVGEPEEELPPALRGSGLAPEWTDYTYDQLCNMAADYSEKGLVMLAIECLQVAAEKEPDSFPAFFNLGQVHEASQELPGSQARAAMLYVTAMENAAPESKTPQYSEWCNAFVHAANLLISLPSEKKPPWWTVVGIKQRCGLLLANPQGLKPQEDLVCPGWRIMAHAFEMDRDEAEAARCYDEAASHASDPDQRQGLLQQAATLRMALA